jgi:hypothetical protein
MGALFLQETGTCGERKEFVCRILEKTRQLFHLIFESADSNMENIKKGKEHFSAPAISRNIYVNCIFH